MANYRLSNEARDDLIRIYQYGLEEFGIDQADRYFDKLFEYFDLIAHQPFLFESVDFIKKGYRHCVVGPDTIYFRINQGITEIMAIVGRQDLDRIL